MFWKSLIISLIISLAWAQIPHSKINQKELVGGRNPKPGEIKYIVVVKSYKSFCGGGIISENHVLTAAHCIKVNETTGKLLKPMKIVANTNVAFGYSPGAVVERDVARVYQPAPYGKDGKNDIAVLELKKPLQTIKHKLQKLNLPEPTSDDPSKYSTYEHAEIKFAGYGNTRADIVKQNGTTKIVRTGAGRLQVAKAVINDAQTCLRHFKKARSDEMCLSIVEDDSKKKPQGTCTGDSGSPAVYEKNVVIGLDSRGIWCNNNLAPTLFTRVSSYVPFIKHAMEGISDGVVYEA